MIKNVIFIGDLCRGDQSTNINNLGIIFSPLLKKYKVESQVHITLTNNNSLIDDWIDIWSKSLASEDDTIFDEFKFSKTLVIGFEMPEWYAKYFDSKNISWLNIKIHPIRFLDDLYFDVKTSIKYDLTKHSVSDSFIDFCVQSLRLRYGVTTRDKSPSTFALFGQTPFDKSVFINGEFQSIENYFQLIDTISKGYDQVVYKPHPYSPDTTLDKKIIDRYHAKVLTNDDTYEVLLNENIDLICAISSSVLYEAPYFGLESYFLEKKSCLFGPPINFFSWLNDSTFWNKIFGNKSQSNIGLPFPSKPNFLRNVFCSWSYQTNERILEDRILSQFHKNNENIYKSISKYNELHNAAIGGIENISDSHKKNIYILSNSLDGIDQHINDIKSKSDQFDIQILSQTNDFKKYIESMDLHLSETRNELSDIYSKIKKLRRFSTDALNHSKTSNELSNEALSNSRITDELSRESLTSSADAKELSSTADKTSSQALGKVKELEILAKNIEIIAHESKSLTEKTDVRVSRAELSISKSLEKSSKAFENSEISCNRSEEADENSESALQQSTKAFENSEISSDISARAEGNSKIALQQATKAFENSEISSDISASAEKNSKIALLKSSKAFENSEISTDRSGKAEDNSKVALLKSQEATNLAADADLAIKRAEKIVKNLGDELTSIYNSRSWRFTYPFRKLFTIFTTPFSNKNVNFPCKLYTLRVPWHTHGYRAVKSLISHTKPPFHTHLYRAFQSLIGNEKYTPHILESPTSKKNIEKNIDEFIEQKRNYINVLQVTNYNIDEYDHGGKIRCYEIRKSLLNQGFNVKTLTISTGKNDFYQNFNCQLNERSFFKQIKDGTVSDWGANEYLAKKLKLYNDIFRDVKHYDPDIVIIEQPFLWPTVESLLNTNAIHKETIIVNSSHNVEKELKETIYNKTFDKKLSTSYTNIVNDIETDLMNRSDLSICVSKNDAEYFKRKCNNVNVSVYGNGQNQIRINELDDKWRNIFTKSKYNWVFVGSWHPPNVNGIKNLIENGLCEQDPNFVKLWIIGNVGNAFKDFSFYKSNTNSVIQIVGLTSQEDIDSAINQCDGIILPIWEGGGSNLKTAQALISGKNIIGTSKSFVGFEEYISSNGVLVTDCPNEFILHIINPSLSIATYERDVEPLLWTNILNGLPSELHELYVNKFFPQNLPNIFYELSNVDAYNSNPTGISRVVHSIANRLNSFIKDISYVVYDNKIKGYRLYDIEENKFIDQELFFKGSDVLLTFCDGWNNIEHVDNLSRLKDKGVDIIPFIYDLIPYIMPQSYGPGFSEIYKDWLREILCIGSAFLTCSKSSLNDIIRFSNELDLCDITIDDLRLGDDVSLLNTSLIRTLETDSFTNYILSVGTIEYRKNYDTLLDAYRILIKKEIPDLPTLIIVGSPGWMDNGVEHQVLHDRLLKHNVKVLTDISDMDLHLLYLNCKFTIYPSTYEGWGLPISESFSYGKACISSSCSSMNEICPTSSVFVTNPLFPEDWADVIENLLRNNKKLLHIENNILNKYERNNWNKVTINLLKYIKNKYS